MKIVVYSALFGDKDPLWSVPQVVRKGAEYILFTERKRREVGLWTRGGSYGRPATMLPGTGGFPASPPTWKQKIVPLLGKDPRRTARYYKIMSHEVLPDADVVIWVDSNIRMLVNPKQALNWLGFLDFAAFTHPDRNCVYQEIQACLQFGKGSKTQLKQQAAAYQRATMPSRWGLASTRCVVRRHTKKIKKLNKAWYAELQKYSVRDQIALPYICWKAKTKWAVIPGFATRCPSFWFIMHGAIP